MPPMRPATPVEMIEALVVTCTARTAKHTDGQDAGRSEDGGMMENDLIIVGQAQC